jgi:hypothetical protein
MTTMTVYQLNIICEDNTTSERVAHNSVWKPEILEACPNNDPNHTHILTGIVSRVSDSNVIPRNDMTDTGGNFKTKGYQFDVSAGPDSDYQEVGVVSFPYNIRVGNVTFDVATDNIGDYFEAYAKPTSPVGVLLTEVSSGTVLHVSNTVMTYLEMGFHAEIFDGVSTTQYLGECCAKNYSTQEVTLKLPVTSTFPAGSIIFVRAYIIESIPVISGRPIQVGSSVAGSTVLVEPTKDMHILYKNMNGNAKKISFIVEMFY